MRWIEEGTALGHYAQLADLAAHPVVDSLLHGRPKEDGHRCTPNIWADCAGCGWRFYFCSASLRQIRAIQAETWLCLPCASERLEDAL